MGEELGTNPLDCLLLEEREKPQDPGSNYGPGAPSVFCFARGCGSSALPLRPCKNW